MTIQERQNSETSSEAVLANRRLLLQEEKGYKPTEVSIDWITVRLEGKVETIAEFIQGSTDESFTTEFNKPKLHGELFKNQLVGTGGTQILFNTNEDLDDVIVIISGDGCRRMGVIDCWRLLRGLDDTFKAHATRLDLKVRMDKRRLDMATLINAVDTHNVKGTTKPSEEHISKDFKKGELVKYLTTNVGSRSSDAYWRIYDPLKLHGIEGVWDLELELKGKKAKECMKRLCALERKLDYMDEFPMRLGALIAQMALGQFDFIDRTADKNVSRCPRLAWWQNVIDLIGRTLKLVCKAYKTKIPENRKWLETNSFPSLAMQREAMGEEKFDEWYERNMVKAKKRLSVEKKALVAEHLRVQLRHG